ncbi:MAG: hypothetical protein GY950_34640 [bacterium]|nr:hypothetical protein [bacterium]
MSEKAGASPNLLILPIPQSLNHVLIGAINTYFYTSAHRHRLFYDIVYAAYQPAAAANGCFETAND